MKIFAPALAALTMSASVFAASITEIPFKKMDGSDATLKEHAGKVVLVVNVASKCGLTKQYAALEDLYKKYGSQGFVVVAFPANNFGNQEPGTNEEIQAFCTGTYGVTFPVMAKLSVKGADQAPLYAALTGPGSRFPGDIEWNFGKFLIGKDGELIARFPSRMSPGDPKIVEAIEAALK